VPIEGARSNRGRGWLRHSCSATTEGIRSRASH